ncbi:ParB family chromosome partitioning protein [Polynucleobacter sphagniphilus]|uniref:ParB/RepB/Spo0J family partition protein n=1 Tax=Polynucleobacter sphagniphilus TaxID=1743169 RepID=UPI002473B26E|nr:ParB N-terminal domain-containing protein [Polynucleobacter sphagniphilus]MDH6303277.1 ParB family chromosome partitioning protein [Polynucleobacter sphagniphilus]
MSKFSDRLAATKNIKAKEVDVEKVLEQTDFRSGPGRTMFAHQELAKAQEELKAVKSGKVKIADLHEVEGRKRSLTPEDFEQLKNNLASNPLVNAIVVRARKEGGYEIISGHNRVQAYRDLGREEIEADIREFEDESVFEAAFYSNLINSTLSDFEKFLGFKKIQETTNETQEQLASRAGVSQSQIAKIFAFDRFSDTAKGLLEKYPHSIGATSAQRMTGANDSRVLPALEKLIAGECNEAQAVSIALAGESKVTQKIEPIIIRSGKEKFAEIKVNKGLVAITLKDESNVAGLLEKIRKLLEEASKA